jgi:long-chain acyl-CoA synthetase
VAIVDQRGQKLPPDTIGEIIFDLTKIKDPFWKNCLKKNPNRRGSYVHSGDLGKTDADGNLYVVGREAPFIKVGANRVAPAEVESVLRSHGKVREAIAFAINPGQSDEAVGVVVVPRGNLTVRELQGYCLEHLDSYMCPRQIEFRKSLPMNSQGKVIRFTAPSEPAE